MADRGDVIAFGVLAIGGLYLLTDGKLFDSFRAPTIPLTPAQQLAAQGSTTLQQQLDAYAQNQATVGSTRAGIALVSGTAGTIATTAGSIAGIAGSTVALATGIGAAAALITWGVVQKGWFRGGEEGVKVNPARDVFIDTWIQAYYPGAGSEKQFEAMARAFADAGVRGDVAEKTIAQLYAADTMEEFAAAATNFVNVLQNGG